MKKIVCVLLAVILLCGVLAGCGTPPATATETEPAETAGAAAEPESTEEAPEPSLAPAVACDLTETLELMEYSVPSTWRKVDAENGNIYYYPTENNADGFLQVFCSYVGRGDDKQREEFVQAGLNGVKSGEGITDFQSEKSSFPNEHSYHFSANIELSGGTYYTEGYMFLHEQNLFIVGTSYPEGTSSELVSTFPVIVESIALQERQPDFLDSEEIRKEVSQCKSQFRFEDLIALTDAYIEENKPAESDSVYAIKEAAEAAAPVIPECNIIADEFEEDNVLYGGVESISSDINFVPYVGDDFGDVTVKVGFKQNGWLFFEKIKIKVGEDDYVSDFFDYFGVTRDVISGGTILEEVNTSFSFKEAEKIINAENPVLRFIGEDEKTRDHDLTESELKALSNIYTVSQSVDTIENILKDYRANNPGV